VISQKTLLVLQHLCIAKTKGVIAVEERIADMVKRQGFLLARSRDGLFSTSCRKESRQEAEEIQKTLRSMIPELPEYPFASTLGKRKVLWLYDKAQRKEAS
jgi:hypothetical protein